MMNLVTPRRMDEFRFRPTNALKYSSTRLTSIHISAFPSMDSFQAPQRNSDNRLGVFGAGYEFRNESFLNLKVLGSYVRRDFHFEDLESFFSPESETDSDSYKITLQNDSYLGKNDVLTFGYEQESQDVIASSVGEEFLDETIRSNSVFAQNKWLGGPFLLTVGGRLDHHSSFGNHFTPRVSAAYQVNENWKIRGSGGTAFRAPSVGDLYYPGYGNPDLKPEKVSRMKQESIGSIREPVFPLLFSTRNMKT